MFHHKRYSLLVLLVLVLALSACAGATTQPPSTSPTIKPPPAEALTTIVGLGFNELPGAVGSSVVWGALGLLLFAVLAWGYKRAVVEEEHPKLPSKATMAIVFGLVLIGRMVWAAAPGTWVTIPADKKGVTLTFGAATKQVLEPGLHSIMPWRDQVALISVREFTYITTSHVDTASEDFPDYTVGARTCDGVDVQIPYTIKFRVSTSAETLPNFYTNYGSLVAAMERVVKAESRQIVREIPTGFPAVSMYASTAILQNPDLITDPELRSIIESVPCGQQAMGFEGLNETIRLQLADKFQKAGLELTFFGVRQPDLGAYGAKLDEIRLAAQDVRIAEQNALKAEQEAKTAVTQAKAQADAAKIQTVTAAQAEAERVKISAEAESNANVTLATGAANATKIKADAEAKANTLVAGSLTPELVQYRITLSLYEKWNGQLPMYSGSTSPFPVLQLPPIPR